MYGCMDLIVHNYKILSNISDLLLEY